MKTVEHLNAVIYLKTARVYAQDNDGSPKIERLITKLANGKTFLNFVRHLHLKGFLKSEPPTVVKVLLIKDGKHSEIDKTPWQKHVEETIAAKQKTEKVDYKKLSEQQALKLTKLDERLKLLEGERNQKNEPIIYLEDDKMVEGEEELRDKKLLELKAKELGIGFRGNIKQKKLLEKIQAIEPDFDL